VARDRRLRVSGRLITSAAGRLLVSYAITGTVLTVIAVVVGGLIGVNFNPAVLTLVTLGAAVLIWLVVVIEDWAPPLTWEDVRFPTSSLHVGSDNRTRRLASLIASSDEVHRMSQRSLRDLLGEITASRLVRLHEADPDDPFSSPAISRPLRSYLTRPPDSVPPLNRRVLHSYLEEISRL
jgi:hypothetical protein